MSIGFRGTSDEYVDPMNMLDSGKSKAISNHFVIKLPRPF